METLHKELMELEKRKAEILYEMYIFKKYGIK